MSGAVQYTHIDDDHLFTGTHDGAAITVSPYLHYKLNETSGIAVSDAMGVNDGEIAGVYTWETGYVGNCFSSAGAAVITNLLASNTIFNSDVTVSMWVKPDDGQITGSADAYFGLDDTVAGDVFYLHHGASPTGTIYAGYKVNGTGCVIRTTDAIFEDGAASNFTHVAITVSAAEGVKLFVNGSQARTTLVSGGLGSITMSGWTSVKTAYIAARNEDDSAERLFAGDIDDFRIYATALSDRDMYAIYRDTNNGTLTDTGALFKSLGVTVGVYCENVTQSTGGAITAVTDDTVVVSGVTWAPGDTYKIYKTATKSSTISTMMTDRSRGWKADPKKLVNGWFKEDVDLDDHGKHKVFGPGQPE